MEGFLRDSCTPPPSNGAHPRPTSHRLGAPMNLCEDLLGRAGKVQPCRPKRACGSQCPPPLLCTGEGNGAPFLTPARKPKASLADCPRIGAPPPILEVQRNRMVHMPPGAKEIPDAHMPPHAMRAFGSPCPLLCAGATRCKGSICALTLAQNIPPHMPPPCRIPRPPKSHLARI